MTESEPHPQTGQPVGLPIDRTTPAPRPGPVTLKGRYGRLEKLTPAHTPDLWSVFAGHDPIWTYIARDGPFGSLAEFSPFRDPRSIRRPVRLCNHRYLKSSGRLCNSAAYRPGHAGDRGRTRALFADNARHSAPKPNISWRVTFSRRSAIAGTNGNAMHSTRHHGAPRCGTVSSTKGPSANT